MAMQHDELTFPTYRKRSKRAFESTLQDQLMPTCATSSTSTLVISQLNVVISTAFAVLRSVMVVVMNAKRVIDKARRRHFGSLLVFAYKEDDPFGDDFSIHPGVCGMNPNS
jgi:hypothetical protein